MIEHLREKHRRSLVIAAFRGKKFRDPSIEELNGWLQYLENGFSPTELICAMRGQNTAPSAAPENITSPLPQEMLDPSLVIAPIEPFTAIDWDAVKRVKELIASKGMRV